MNHLIFNLCIYINKYIHELQDIKKNLQAFVGVPARAFFNVIKLNIGEVMDKPSIKTTCGS